MQHTTTMEALIEYKITPAENSETYATEIWTVSLESGKRVSVLATTTYRSGEFTLEMDYAQKDRMLSLHTISFLDFPGVCCEEVCDVIDFQIEIKDKDSYSLFELNEINTLMQQQPDPDASDDEYEYPESVMTNTILETNGWTLEDTLYGFNCPCEIEPTN